MLVKTIRTGGDRNLAYLVADPTTAEGIIIDPSFSPQVVARAAEELRLDVRAVFCTHGHADHTNGNRLIRRLLGIEPLLYGDTDPASGEEIRHGFRITVGDLAVEVLHTPGHTDDSICLRIGDAVFTGDTLFVGKVGGTGFGDDALAEYESLHNRLMVLPDHIRVFPGHDYGVAPSSTIGAERTTNPFLLQPDFESFVHLKRTWSQYKLKHGIA
ncbi:MBL fold metallo-hydrolase [Candidatus Bipolaricaulota bacterium]|nr:MBL fold metallo-hydrolase [Candidatus Bipolaricaulota bacterium]